MVATWWIAIGRLLVGEVWKQCLVCLRWGHCWEMHFIRKTHSCCSTDTYTYIETLIWIGAEIKSKLVDWQKMNRQRTTNFTLYYFVSFNKKNTSWIQFHKYEDLLLSSILFLLKNWTVAPAKRDFDLSYWVLGKWFVFLIFDWLDLTIDQGINNITEVKDILDHLLDILHNIWRREYTA